MTSQRSFVRKITYFSLIGLLLLPLYWLSLPATGRREGTPTGGKLARLRQEYKLSQANLGEIDPTSVTMKLSTFGLHGVAANLLWSTAIYAKETEDWTTFSAALEQIMNLQPHFVKVWQFQAHNVAFNISYEFDDYRDRYHYVIKGIKLLERGIRYNDRNPRILRDLAHFISFKIGRSDESVQFRELFRNDDDFHKNDRMLGTRYAGRDPTVRDSWLIAKWWYAWADRLLDTNEAAYTTLSPAVVHADAPRMQMEYARALETEGHFGQQAADAWRVGGEEWNAFGSRLMPTTDGYSLRLEDLNRQQQQVEKLRAEFDALVAAEPGLEEKVRAALREKLTAEEEAALNLPEAQRSKAEQSLAGTALYKLRISPRDLALAMSPQRRNEALRLADRLQTAEDRLSMIERYRGIPNYAYWKVRCEIERRLETVAARKAIYDGDRAYADSDLVGALDFYTEGVAAWKKVIDAYPPVLDEKSMIEELLEVIHKYQRILAQNDKPLPKPFDLQVVLDRYETLKKKGESIRLPAGD